jgi:hypothetical protein
MPHISAELIHYRLREVGELFENRIFNSLLADRSDQREAWAKRLSELEEAFAKPPETTVAFIGSTGAGKSTLLNALLGAQILPVSSMKPCTAVITTVRSSTAHTYQAQISFITEEEWTRELYASAEFLNTDLGEEESRDTAEWNMLKRVTQDKIRAVYGDAAVSNGRLNLQNLELPEQLRNRMMADAEPVLIQETDPKAFSKRLKEYLSGESNFWPVVRGVDIAGPFQSLSAGTALIDLPGVNDPNQAREEITRKYLRDASYIWVTYNINRGVTKDIRDLLVEQKMLRQFLLEGKVNTLTMVGTHADEISGVDPQEFDLADPSPLEIIQARNSKVNEQTRKDLADIGDDLAQLAGATSDEVHRLRSTLEQTKIFTVSTRAYMKLRGIGIIHTDFHIDDAQETHIPQLLQHLECIIGTQRHADEIELKLSLLLSEIESFFRASLRQLEPLQGTLKVRLEELRGTLKQPRINLDAELLNAQQRADESFNAHQEIFEQRLQLAIENAQTVADRVLDDWSVIHWATLKALVVRNGAFVSPSTGKRYDLNADIVDPLLKAIPFVWDDFFGRHFDTSLAELKGQLEGRVEVFLERLKYEAKHTGAFDEVVLGNLSGDIEVSRKSLELQIKLALYELKRTITRTRVELAASITATIAKQMEPAYERARLEKGAGLKTRMLNILRGHARPGFRQMYETVQQDLTDGIINLKVQFTGELARLIKYIAGQADRVLSNLGGGIVATQTEDANALILKVGEVLRQIDHLRTDRKFAAEKA